MKKVFLATSVITLFLLSGCGSKVGSEPSTKVITEAFISDCDAGFSQKPSSITLACADGGMSLEHISYSSWSSSSAEGAGTLSEVCGESCDVGWTKTPVTFSISQPKKDAEGKLVFTKLTINSKSKLFNGKKSAEFDIGPSSLTSSDAAPATNSPQIKLSPAEAVDDLLARLNETDQLWSLNQEATSDYGQMAHKKLGLYSEPDYVLQCDLPYSGTWLFLYSNEDMANQAISSTYFFRKSYYSAKLLHDNNSNYPVIVHTSMGGNKTCLESALSQLYEFGTD
jgi:hypothetical protein